MFNKIRRKFHTIFNSENDEYDMSLTMLKDMFDLLVDYVEVEKAISYAIVNNNDKFMPSWNPFSKRFKLWYRDKELGIMRLEQEMDVDIDTDVYIDDKPEVIKSNQSKTALEVLELYKWWKSRQHRISDFMEDVPLEEDQMMLKRLINIRMELFS